MGEKREEISKLSDKLEEATSLIESDMKSLPTVHNGAVNSMEDAASLLERCERVVKIRETKKPVIRIVHHLFKPGNTGLAALLSSMPNTYVVRDLHPHDMQCESNPLSHLANVLRQSNIPGASKIGEDLFVDLVVKTNNHLNNLGSNLILFDNLLLNLYQGGEKNSRSIVDLLSNKFQVRSLLVINEPIETFEWLQSANLGHKFDFSFQEYCSILLKLANSFTEKTTVKYNEVRGGAANSVNDICYKLDIPYSDNYDLFCEPFDDYFALHKNKSQRTLANDEIAKSESYFEFKKITKPIHKKLILISTMPRSGSTWLFNCIREIYKLKNIEFYSEWIEEYEPANSALVHIVKVHEPEFQLTSEADLIISTRRDIRDVCTSLIRMGWLKNEELSVVEQANKLANTVHPFWYSRSDLEVEYSNILDNTHALVNEIALKLDFTISSEECEKVVQYLDSLSSPKKYDKETQLHPAHRNNIKTDYQAVLSSSTLSKIDEAIGVWLEKFNYN